MNRIKELRKKMGYTQMEFSKKCNISQAALSGYETGRYEPDFVTLGIMADIFGVTVDYLLCRTNTNAQINLQRFSNQDEPNDDEVMEFREEMRRNPGMKMLFKAARGASVEDLQRAVKIIEALRGTSDD